MVLKWIRLGLDEEALTWLQAQGNMSQKVRELIHEKRLAKSKAARGIAIQHTGRPSKNSQWQEITFDDYEKAMCKAKKKENAMQGIVI
jgi:hypothetical protein